MPAEIAAGDVEGFLLDLVRRGRSPLTRNVSLAAIRCLLAATLEDVSHTSPPAFQTPNRRVAANGRARD